MQNRPRNRLLPFLDTKLSANASKKPKTKKEREAVEKERTRIIKLRDKVLRRKATQILFHKKETRTLLQRAISQDALLTQALSEAFKVAKKSAKNPEFENHFEGIFYLIARDREVSRPEKEYQELYSHIEGILIPLIKKANPESKLAKDLERAFLRTKQTILDVEAH